MTDPAYAQLSFTRATCPDHLILLYVISAVFGRQYTILSLWYAVFSIPRLQLPSCGRVFLQHTSTVFKLTQSAFFRYCQKLHTLKIGKIKVLFLDKPKRDIQLWTKWSKRLPNFFGNWNLIPTKHLMHATVNSICLCMHLKVNLVNLLNSA